MVKVLEMAEAHLLNVQREINTLEQRKVEIDTELEKLRSYLQDGVQELQSNVNENSPAEGEDVPPMPEGDF